MEGKIVQKTCCEIYWVPAHLWVAARDLSSQFSYFMTNPTERNYFGRACSDLPEDVTMEQRGELV